MRKLHNLRLFALIFLLSVSLVILGFNFVQGQGKPDKPPGKNKDKPKPSAPRLDLSGYNIVTAEPGGTGHLHVWGNTGSTFDKIWTAESVNHSSTAIGDLDGDGSTREIVAPTSCRISGKKGKGQKGTTYYKYFINVYQEGFDASEYEMGIWRSTYYDSTDNNIKETNPWKSEIAIANVDGGSLNEVVLLTANYIAVFRYDASMVYAYNGEPGAFQKIAELNVADSMGKTSLVMRSLACGDIDGDDKDEILIAANVPGSGVNQSYILAYDYSSDSGLKLIDYISIDDASIGHQSLRLADLDGDESVELCSTAYIEDQGSYQSYVFIWEQDENGNFVTRHSISIGSDTDPPWNHLDTGELSDSPGDEIVLSIGHKRQIFLYKCERDGGDLDLGYINDISSYPTFINGVKIADTDGTTGNEIVVYGGTLEVYSSDLKRTIWKRIERPDDGEIWYVAIGGLDIF